MSTMTDTEIALPPRQAVPPAPRSRNPPTSSPHKRNPRHHQNPTASIPQVDGTVSDSVTNPLVSPRSKKGAKQRQQSVALGALPYQNGHTVKAHDNKQRPVSFGGSILPATPLKEQAYAGPTFSASPAPSSLPVPKFFSKSVPNVVQRPLDARMAGEKTPEKHESSPEPDVVLPPQRSHQSPLDVFFKADRAEKEKIRSPNSLSPETAARPQPTPQRRNPAPQPSQGVFLGELHSHDSDKLSANAMSPNNHYSPTYPNGTVPNESAREQYTESELTKSLKEMLFNGSAAPSQTSTPPNQQRPQSNSSDLDLAVDTPSPFQRSISGPSTPTPSAQQYSLHYGNRNLSPLFRAARSDTPPRPSGLRQQELASDPASSTNSSANAPPPRHVPQIDPNSYSRNYLDRVIQNSQPAPFPQLPLTSNTNHPTPPPNSAPYQHQQGVQGSGTGAAGGAPRTGIGNGASRDIKGMEDDLRKMLNLNVC